MKTVCTKDMCTGCMACVERCPKNTIRIEDGIWSYNAVIQEDLCVDCGLCHKVCPQNTNAAASAPAAWYQGWAEEENLRSGASSGGFAGGIATGFLKDGGAVCSCCFNQGEFTFAFAETVEEIARFAGSKYVKSNPLGIYSETQKRLQNGQRILFIGLPCQVAALSNYIPASLRQNLYTVELICHGTPSPKVLECFLNRNGKTLNGLQEIQFRQKGNFQIHADGQPVGTKGVRDSYMMAFLNAACYTENCYHCRYAHIERVADLTIGDSWGSALPEAEQKKGISLCLCQTEKGKLLLEAAALHLEPVDLDVAVANNQQLQKPVEKHGKRDGILYAVSKKKGFDKAVFRSCPKQYFRQFVKKALIRCGVLKR